MRMQSPHVTDEQLDRYRRRVAEPSELLLVDEHIATCDRCYALVRVDPHVVLPAVDREEHLEYEELERYVDGSASDAERELVAGHTESCELCRRELGDLEAVAGVVRAARARPGRGTRARGGRAHYTWVAAVVVVIIALWVLTRPRPQPADVEPQVATGTVSTAEPRRAALPPIVLERPAILDSLIREGGVLRGTGVETFTLQQPVGTVVLEERPRFRWTPVRNASSYDVAVVDAERGSVAASGSTPSTRWQPAAALPHGRTYTWQVTAHAGGTTIVAPGPSGAEALFRVEQEEALPASAIERGVALARRGVLDDAERELARAVREGDPRAAALLDQVRSWRQRALPTTTNGAQ